MPYKTRAELAAAYAVSTKTFSRMLARRPHYTEGRPR